MHAQSTTSIKRVDKFVAVGLSSGASVEDRGIRSRIGRYCNSAIAWPTLIAPLGPAHTSNQALTSCGKRISTVRDSGGAPLSCSRVDVSITLFQNTL